MIEPRIPKYQWGQFVLAATDIFNDGSYPEKEADSMLVSHGVRGEIVQIGTHTESQTPVYLVEFGEGLVVGCLEEEISPV